MNVLTHKEELIVRAVAFYRFMTAEDVAQLLFVPSSLSHVREVLARLSGKDFDPDHVLYRFKLPDVKGGNPLRVYTLGRRGKQFVGDSWRFRPDKSDVLSFNYLQHSLTLTKFLIAAALWARKAGCRLTVRTCYELATLRQYRQAMLAIPDAWLLLERTRKYPVILEIDQGTEYKEKFKKHVKARIELYESGKYEEIFGTDAVSVAYVTPSQARREAMLTWLKEMAVGDWERVFWFASLPGEAIYTSGLFAEPIWQQASATRSAPLLPVS